MAVKKKAVVKAKPKVVRKKRAPAKKHSDPAPQPAAPAAAPPVPDEAFMGRYSNVATVRHTPREFILDFNWNLGERSVLASRVITSPAHAKQLYEALGRNLALFEKLHGRIVTGDEREDDTPMH